MHRNYLVARALCLVGCLAVNSYFDIAGVSHHTAFAPFPLSFLMNPGLSTAVTIIHHVSLPNAIGINKLHAELSPV